MTLSIDYKTFHLMKDFFSVTLLMCFICNHCSSDEPMVRLQHKISASLRQALEKLKLTEDAVEKKGEAEIFISENLFDCCKMFHCIFPLSELQCV